MQFTKVLNEIDEAINWSYLENKGVRFRITENFPSYGKRFLVIDDDNELNIELDHDCVMIQDSLDVLIGNNYVCSYFLIGSILNIDYINKNGSITTLLQFQTGSILIEAILG